MGREELPPKASAGGAHKAPGAIGKRGERPRRTKLLRPRGAQGTPKEVLNEGGVPREFTANDHMKERIGV